MAPHHYVHGGCHHNRLVHRQVHRGQKIVRNPMRHLANHIRRRRHHHQRLRRLSLVDVLNRCPSRHLASRPERANHLVPADCRKGERRHKLLRPRCHHDMRIETGLLQSAHQLHRPVRRNPSTNPDRYLRAHPTILSPARSKKALAAYRNPRYIYRRSQYSDSQ